MEIKAVAPGLTVHREDGFLVINTKVGDLAVTLYLTCQETARLRAAVNEGWAELERWMVAPAGEREYEAGNEWPTKMVREELKRGLPS